MIGRRDWFRQAIARVLAAWGAVGVVGKSGAGLGTRLPSQEKCRQSLHSSQAGPLYQQGLDPQLEQSWVLHRSVPTSSSERCSRRFATSITCPE